MSTDRYQILLERTKNEFPRFNVRSRAWWLRAVFCFLKIFGSGGDGYVTTIFSTMYVPDDFGSWNNDKKYRLLRHEKIHVKQFYEFPFGPRFWRLNHLIVAFLYILVLPVFWTFRAKFEREGYTQSMLVWFEDYGPMDERMWKGQVNMMLVQFSTGAYCWMWRARPTRKWTNKTLEKIHAGEIRNEADYIPRAA